MKLRFCLAAALCVATASPGARAQAWRSDRRFREGLGIRRGNLELHPSLAGELGYDSNLFQRAGGESEPVIDVLRLRITPALALATLGAQRRELDAPNAQPPKVDFRGHLSAAYNEFVSVDSEYRNAVSRQRDISAGVHAILDILPTRPWGGTLYGDFVRTIEPSNSPEDQFAWDRDAFRFGAGLVWRPGGGMFQWALGYELRYNHFEAGAFRDLNNTHNYLKTKGHWRFLPRTALVYDAEFGFIRYAGNEYLNDSTPVRSRLGLNGLLTSRLSLLAMAGWGASFYSGNTTSPVQDYDSLIAQGEVKWYARPQQRLPSDAGQVGLSTVAVGYLRNFADSHVSDYYQIDRVHADADYFVAGAVLLSLQVGYSRLGYPRPFFPGGVARNPPGGPYYENRLDTELLAEYRFSNSVALNTTLRYDLNITDAEIETIQGLRAGASDRLEFSRFQMLLGARWSL